MTFDTSANRDWAIPHIIVCYNIIMADCRKILSVEFLKEQEHKSALEAHRIEQQYGKITEIKVNNPPRGYYEITVITDHCKEIRFMIHNQSLCSAVRGIWSLDGYGPKCDYCAYNPYSTDWIAHIRHGIPRFVCVRDVAVK
jgi:hypothetical protein